MLFPPVVALRQLQNVHKGKAFGIPEISFLWKVTGFHWWRSSENTVVGKSMVKGTAPSEASMQNGIAFPFAPTGQRSRFVPPVFDPWWAVPFDNIKILNVIFFIILYFFKT